MIYDAPTSKSFQQVTNPHRNWLGLPSGGSDTPLLNLLPHVPELVPPADGVVGDTGDTTPADLGPVCTLNPCGVFDRLALKLVKLTTRFIIFPTASFAFTRVPRLVVALSSPLDFSPTGDLSLVFVVVVLRWKGACRNSALRRFWLVRFACAWDGSCCPGLRGRGRAAGTGGDGLRDLLLVLLLLLSFFFLLHLDGDDVGVVGVGVDGDGLARS